MATTYPTTKQTFTDPNGATRIDTGIDHAGLHTDINDTVEAMQDTVGTTAGTNVLKNFAAGDFPARINSSNVLQQVVTGTVNTTVGTLSGAVIGTPSISAGTWSNAQLIGTAQITGGTLTSAVVTSATINNSTIGTPAITGGTITSTVVLPVTSNTAKARAYLNSAQNNLADTVFTKVLLDAEDYDVGNNFASNKFTAPVTGYYMVTGQVAYDNTIANSRYFSALYRNGTVNAASSIVSSTTQTLAVTSSDIMFLNAAETVELYARVDAGASTIDLIIGLSNTFLAVHLLSI